MRRRREEEELELTFPRFLGDGEVLGEADGRFPLARPSFPTPSLPSPPGDAAAAPLWRLVTAMAGGRLRFPEKEWKSKPKPTWICFFLLLYSRRKMAELEGEGPEGGGGFIGRAGGPIRGLISTSEYSIYK